MAARRRMEGTMILFTTRRLWKLELPSLPTLISINSIDRISTMQQPPYCSYMCMCDSKSRLIFRTPLITRAVKVQSVPSTLYCLCAFVCAKENWVVMRLIAISVSERRNSTQTHFTQKCLLKRVYHETNGLRSHFVRNYRYIHSQNLDLL